jgi:uncharacterized membrane protein YeaQ/YmgE (transglycosylase-associated protein family)
MIIGIALGFISRFVMPVPMEDGDQANAIVGLLAGLASGSLATIWSHGRIWKIDSTAIAIAVIGVLYLLFAYRCLAMRRR